MVFLPFGVAGKEVVDPEQLARDFQEAFRIANDQTQWQWKDGAFTDINKLERGPPVQIEAVSKTAILNTQPGIWPLIRDDGGADSDQWKIPYMRGFAVVGDPNISSSEMRLEWRAEYPELVFCCFSFQYVRREYGRSPWIDGTILIRTQIRLRMDGSLLPGTGPLSHAFDARTRGTGYGVKGLASDCIALVLLPAGTHELAAVAAQTSSITDNVDSEGKEWDIPLSAPTEGVVIGNRRLFALRFGRALPLVP